MDDSDGKKPRTRNNDRPRLTEGWLEQYIDENYSTYKERIAAARLTVSKGQVVALYESVFARRVIARRFEKLYGDSYRKHYDAIGTSPTFREKIYPLLKGRLPNNYQARDADLRATPRNSVSNLASIYPEALASVLGENEPPVERHVECECIQATEVDELHDKAVAIEHHRYALLNREGNLAFAIASEYGARRAERHDGPGSIDFKFGAFLGSLPNGELAVFSPDRRCRKQLRELFDGCDNDAKDLINELRKLDIKRFRAPGYGEESEYERKKFRQTAEICARCGKKFKTHYFDINCQDCREYRDGQRKSPHLIETHRRETSSSDFDSVLGGCLDGRVTESSVTSEGAGLPEGPCIQLKLDGEQKKPRDSMATGCHAVMLPADDHVAKLQKEIEYSRWRAEAHRRRRNPETEEDKKKVESEILSNWKEFVVQQARIFTTLNPARRYGTKKTRQKDSSVTSAAHAKPHDWKINEGPKDRVRVIPDGVRLPPECHEGINAFIRRSPRTSAIDWLKSALSDGPRDSQDLLDEWEAVESGEVEALKRAKKTLRIEVFRPDSSGPWFWRLNEFAIQNTETREELEPDEPALD